MQCSRHISAVARPFRFITVSLTGPEQLARFRYAFRAAAQQALRDGGRSVYVDRLIISYRGSATRLLPRNACSRVHRVDAWLDGLPNLFAYVSGGLRELVLLLSAPSLISAISMVVLQHFGMITFPALETLAFSCAAEEPEMFERFAVQPLPSLRWLQVDTQGCIRMLLPILQSIPNA
jgi:hypothetical protein